MTRLRPDEVIADWREAFTRANPAAQMPELFYSGGWYRFRHGLSLDPRHYRGAQIVHMTGVLHQRALAHDAGVLAQQRFTEARSLFDELREKIGMAATSGREPVAVCVSDDIWRRLRSEAEAMRYVTIENPTTHLPETAMGLPVEHVGGVNHLSVRVRGETPKG